jgi:hypothetical protein
MPTCVHDTQSLITLYLPIYRQNTGSKVGDLDGHSLLKTLYKGLPIDSK